MVRTLLRCCLLLALLLGRAAPAQTVYRFAPVNQYGLELTASYWNPILEYVSARSGVALQLKLARTSAETTAAVLDQEVDFVFTNHLFSPERDHLGWKVFGRRQTPPLHSQIVVLADSPITSLEQLADQPVAFPGPEGLITYKFAYAQLLNRHIAVQVLFGGNMDGAFAQLVSGRAKAVGANSQLTAGWAQREHREVRVLWQSEPLYDLALMASRRVPEKVLKAVADAFLGMAQDSVGQAVLARSSALVKLPPATQFVHSDGSEYGAYRRFFQTVPASLR